MNDIIQVKELTFQVYLGVYDCEMKKPRPVTVDLAIEFDASKAEKSDNLSDTIDYASLCETIVARTGAESGNRYSLVERLAGEIAQTALDFDTRAQTVKVTLGKPGAVPNARTVEINITRTR